MEPTPSGTEDRGARERAVAGVVVLGGAGLLAGALGLALRAARRRRTIVGASARGTTIGAQ